jgi:hypothetical protein
MESARDLKDRLNCGEVCAAADPQASEKAAATISRGTAAGIFMLDLLRRI